LNTHTDANSFVKERKDALLAMYQENRAHARHHESQRLTVTSIIIAATVGLVSLIAHNSLSREDWPLTFALILIGLYGTFFTATQFERVRLYKHRANEYRDALDALLFTANGGRVTQTLKSIIEKSDKEHCEQFPLLRKLAAVKSFWILWPLTIAVIGTVATLYVLTARLPPPPSTAPAVTKETPR
jgi:hypothetical protein